MKRLFIILSAIILFAFSYNTSALSIPQIDGTSCKHVYVTWNENQTHRFLSGQVFIRPFESGDPPLYFYQLEQLASYNLWVAWINYPLPPPAHRYEVRAELWIPIPEYPYYYSEYSEWILLECYGLFLPNVTE